MHLYFVEIIFANVAYLHYHITKPVTKSSKSDLSASLLYSEVVAIDLQKYMKILRNTETMRKLSLAKLSMLKVTVHVMYFCNSAFRGYQGIWEINCNEFLAACLIRHVRIFFLPIVVD